MTLTVRAYEPASDADWLLALNNTYVREICEETPESLRAVLGQALATRVAERDGARAGAVVLIPRGLPDYESLNYRWFMDQSDEDFLYVDRVMVSSDAKGGGIGRALYEDAGRIAKARGIPRITCEVNEDPPNPASVAFHERMGFRPLASRYNPISRKTVLMMEKRL
ncbi:MAG: GNAT family N-acetyltransferase [Pseudomonadota bacterium]